MIRVSLSFGLEWAQLFETPALQEVRMKKVRWMIALTLVMGLLSGPLLSNAYAVTGSGGGTGGGTGDMPTSK